MNNVTVGWKAGLNGQKNIYLSDGIYDILRRPRKFSKSFYRLLNISLDDIVGKYVTKTKK